MTGFSRCRGEMNSREGGRRVQLHAPMTMSTTKLTFATDFFNSCFLTSYLLFKGKQGKAISFSCLTASFHLSQNPYIFTTRPQVIHIGKTTRIALSTKIRLPALIQWPNGIFLPTNNLTRWHFSRCFLRDCPVLFWSSSEHRSQRKPPKAFCNPLELCSRVPGR